MQIGDRIKALIQLGEQLREKDEFLDALMHRTEFHNPWFTKDNQRLAVQAIANQMLQPEKLEAWLGPYNVSKASTRQTIGLVMAGNIPLVGFHDWLCVFAAGHRAQVKLSGKDPYLFPYVIRLLEKINPDTAVYTEIVPQLQGFDAVIATGSNNSARYFEAYFQSYPHIIRRNRHGVGVLTGGESIEDIRRLGVDIFRYFGLGCRNVSKLYLPRGYAFQPLLETLHEYRAIIQHTKYKNNFDYNYALLELNKTPYLNNGCLILLEDKSLSSRIATLHYEYYDDPTALEDMLHQQADHIQCIIAAEDGLAQRTYSFGQAQYPELWDYADGVDTVEFLKDLGKGG